MCCANDLMNSMLILESSMFSGQVNCTLQPPEARGVEANSYVGSGSTTATVAPGAWFLMKWAALHPMSPPPMIATSNLCVGWDMGAASVGVGAQEAVSGVVDRYPGLQRLGAVAQAAVTRQARTPRVHQRLQQLLDPDGEVAGAR